MIYDVIIIGAGVVGGAVARELSKLKLDILALEKESDVCCGTSKANTGIIHSPALVPSGTLKGRMSALGNLQFTELSGQLGFTYQKTGALVLSYSEENDKTALNDLKQGCENWLDAGAEAPEYEIISAEKLRELEPEISDEVVSALYCPDAGRIIPYEYGIALWENAVDNGVELRLECGVFDVSYDEAEKLWHLKTPSGEILSRFVVNAAGHGSNSIGMAAGFKDSRIKAVKGEYIILDRDTPQHINHILFQIPDEAQKSKGKGILVTRTVYGNIMIGPDARSQDDADDTSTDMESLIEVIAGAEKSIPGLDMKKAIKTFAGVRPKPAEGDFIIESRNGFVHLCGIESPGLTSSPAIAAEAVERLKKMGLSSDSNTEFNPFRKPIVGEVLNLPHDVVSKRIQFADDDPEKLICRCEQVPLSRIEDAVSRSIPVTTIDGVKRRTRAGQGRCQGNFCGPRVKKVLADILNLEEELITRRGKEPELKRISAAELRKIVKEEPVLE